MMKNVSRAPCSDGIHHTSYMLTDGPGEGEVQPFPVENFKLTSATHQKDIRAEMLKNNLKLVVPES